GRPGARARRRRRRNGRRAPRAHPRRRGRAGRRGLRPRGGRGQGRVRCVGARVIDSTLTAPSSSFVRASFPVRRTDFRPPPNTPRNPRRRRGMRRIAFALLVVSAAAAAVAVALVSGPGPDASRASSHREAPLISNDPAADNTDLYAFVSPDAPKPVTIVANSIPLEHPAGGPNFASFGDDVRYEIKVDNNGDGEEDVTYRFRFKTITGNPNTFLYNTGPIDTLSDSDWNVRQTYTVTRINHRGAKVLGTDIPVPPVNIGPRSTPGYDALADAAIADLEGAKVFAGQRDDPFYVDLGSIFDLAGLRPFNSLHDIPLPDGPGVDGVGGYNTHSIVLHVQIRKLKRAHKLHAADEPEAVLGVYATASRQRVRVLQHGDVRNEAGWVQISRLGEPLITEAVLPRGKKDLWNSPDGPSTCASCASTVRPR